jgi:hypothetical protein
MSDQHSHAPISASGHALKMLRACCRGPQTHFCAQTPNTASGHTCIAACIDAVNCAAQAVARLKRPMECVCARRAAQRCARIECVRPAAQLQHAALRGVGLRMQTNVNSTPQAVVEIKTRFCICQSASKPAGLPVSPTRSHLKQTPLLSMQRTGRS